MTMIGRRLLLINQKIKTTCNLYNIDFKKINLVAVSKMQNQESIIAAIEAGCNIFGENYLNEAQEKWSQLKILYPKIKLHLIGHLQSNKIKEALGLFDVIESLDSEKLAIKIKNKILKLQFESQNKFASPEIFIQVNIGEEETKSGINPAEAKEFISFAKNDCKLKITGLMAIPPQDEAPAPYFALLAKIAKENSLKNLSMGMSADYQDAIALGANYIRLGTAIFGSRNN
jgi:pyridoxal phosphate enzyme (YggS family)